MGYRKITSLYKEAIILNLFKEVYALEKIHGTSAHVAWKDGKIRFFSGGEKHDKFVSLFNEEELITKFQDTGHYEIIVYGEAYGGRMQRMAATYGKENKFVAFEVFIKANEHLDGAWLDVERAHKFVEYLDLEFVHYVRGPATLAFVDAQGD